MNDAEGLVSAAFLDAQGILRKGSAYRMAKQNIIPHYKVGARRTGIRFRVSEVLQALRQPVKSIQGTLLDRARFH